MNEEIVKKLLGLRIKQLRKKANLTQFALGEKTSIDQRQIAYIEGGNCFPSLKTLIKLANVFKYNLKDLFDYEHFIEKEDLHEKIRKSLENLSEKELNLCHSIINMLKNNS